MNRVGVECPRVDNDRTIWLMLAALLSAAPPKKPTEDVKFKVVPSMLLFQVFSRLCTQQ